MNRDARVERTLAQINRMPLAEFSADALAEVALVSQSYLRSLFRRQLGCTASQYAAWVAAWRALDLLGEGMLFTDVALDAGFHDLSHLDRTTKRFYGLSVSGMLKTPGVRFMKC